MICRSGCGLSRQVTAGPGNGCPWLASLKRHIGRTGLSSRCAATPREAQKQREEQDMTEEIARYETKAEIIEKVVIGGDLSKLSAEERVSYYRAVCESLGLNPLTRPFDYITLNGKLTLYAKKDATDQLRDKHNVSTFVVSRERIDDIYVVTVHATLPNGRQDEEIGAVSIAGLKGEALANAMMKAGTKAKRRVTLSIVGLGMLDETEVETITMTSATIMPPVSAARACGHQRERQAGDGQAEHGERTRPALVSGHPQGKAPPGCVKAVRGDDDRRRQGRAHRGAQPCLWR